MTGGLTTILPVLFALAVTGALVTTIFALWRRFSQEARSDEPKESAQETWRTAVPWIGCAALLIVVLLVVYSLTR